MGERVCVENGVEPLSVEQIAERVRQCMRLPALSSTNAALRELLRADQGSTQEISEIIARDPSLASRVLRLVNSVYLGLRQRVTTIEQAVFYLGIRQVRQLATVTPVIEEFQRLAGPAPFTWRQFWHHCIATGVVAQELAALTKDGNDERAYIGGLLHDVGKIVIASQFPKHFVEIRRRLESGTSAPGADGERRPMPDLLEVEREVLGADHAEVGGIYLDEHPIDPMLAGVARHHHSPGEARDNDLAAAVQIADLMVRGAGIGRSGQPGPVTARDCANAEGWNVLCPSMHEAQRAIARASLERTLARLPMILEGLV